MHSVREVAEILNVSASCVYQIVAQGRLPCHRVGTGRGTIRVSKEDLADYLKAVRVVQSAIDAPLERATRGGRRFEHLKSDRLLAAWQRQGVRAVQPDASSSP